MAGREAPKQVVAVLEAGPLECESQMGLRIGFCRVAEVEAEAAAAFQHAAALAEDLLHPAQIGLEIAEVVFRLSSEGWRTGEDELDGGGFDLLHAPAVADDNQVFRSHEIIAGGRVSLWKV